MILEGFQIMIVGMTLVMLFLSLMVVLINGVAWLTQGVAEQELAKIQVAKLAKQASQKRVSSSGELPIAVFAAAVAAFEADKQNQ
ncbi:OadG family protein [Deltaproteobacteria bacterium TL4]